MVEQNTRAPRFHVKQLTAIYDTGDSFWSGPVLDASFSGLRIAAVQELSIGTEVSLIPDVPEDDDRLPFEVRGRVVRVQPLTKGPAGFDVALEFIGLTDQQKKQLQAFLVDHGVTVRDK